MLSSTKLGSLCFLCLALSWQFEQSVGIPTPYQFAYRVDSTEGSHGHAEYSDGNGRVEGFYVIELSDGRIRTVRYYADETGFHPTIETNEPGVASSYPADASYKAAVASIDRLQPKPDPVLTTATGPAFTDPTPLPKPVIVADYAPAALDHTAHASVAVAEPAPVSATSVDKVPAPGSVAPTELTPVVASPPDAEIATVDISMPVSPPDASNTAQTSTPAALEQASTSTNASIAPGEPVSENSLPDVKDSSGFSSITRGEESR